MPVFPKYAVLSDIGRLRGVMGRGVGPNRCVLSRHDVSHWSGMMNETTKYSPPIRVKLGRRGRLLLIAEYLETSNADLVAIGCPDCALSMPAFAQMGS